MPPALPLPVRSVIAPPQDAQKQIPVTELDRLQRAGASIAGCAPSQPGAYGACQVCDDPFDTLPIDSGHLDSILCIWALARDGQGRRSL